MPANPGLILEPDSDDGWEVTPRHSDEGLWELQLADLFGTRSISLVRVFLDRLRDLVPTDYDDEAGRWKTNETEWNAALATVAGVKPRNVQEAMLAAQMVSVHWMQMRLSAQALNSGGMVIAEDAALASKMARTFTMQLDALRGLRGGKSAVRQTIKVTKTLRQEVHYHDHRGAAENDGQSHTTPGTQIVEQRATLPSQGEGNGAVVPFTRSKRAANLPNARRDE